MGVVDVKVSGDGYGGCGMKVQTLILVLLNPLANSVNPSSET